jgi:hypothetical protein
MVRATGTNTLRYTGVQPVSPPNLQTYIRPPTVRDSQNFFLGDMWLVKNSAIPENQNVYILVSLNGGLATWVLFASGFGDVQALRADDGLIALPLAGIINIAGGTGIVTNAAVANTVTISTSTSVATQYNEDVGSAIPLLHNLSIIGGTSTGGVATNINTRGAGNIVTICLNNSISQPNTNAAGTTGLYSLGGNRFLHNYGTDNTFVGNLSGNLTLTVLNATGNTCIGNNSGQSLTTARETTSLGANAASNITTGIANVAIGSLSLSSATSGPANAGGNTAVGTDSLLSLTSGIQNQAVGNSAGSLLLTGNYNTLIGSGGVGANYTGAESSNVLINSFGVNGESNTIRIGTQGGAANQQNRCFIAGIRGVTTGVNDAIAVLIDSAHQLGTVSSSKRYKFDINDMSEISQKIYDLRPVMFKYNQFPDERPNPGLIAEEVYEVMPQLVVRNEEGLPETVKYHELCVYLLNELKVLKARLDEIDLEKLC